MPNRPETPLPGSFRRRFPLELTPAECEQLEHHARGHGSKRAALLAGLTALAEHSALGSALAQAEQERDELRTDLAAAQQRATDLEAQLAEIAKQASSANTKDQVRTKRERAERASTQAALDQLKRALGQECELRTELEDELDDLRDRAVDLLHCARCDTWAPPEQWATKTHQGRDHIYHHPCGFHTGGLLGTTILALQHED